MITNINGETFTKGELATGLSLIFAGTFASVVGIWAAVKFLINLFQGNYPPVITTAFVIAFISTVFVAWANFGTHSKD